MSMKILPRLLSVVVMSAALWIGAGCGANSPIPIDGESKTKAKTFVANGGRMASGAVANATATITVAQAEAAVLAKQPGTIVNTTLGMDDSVSSYDIRVKASDGKTYEVVVDASTGSVITESEGTEVGKVDTNTLESNIESSSETK